MGEIYKSSVVPIEEVERFVTDCMMKSGADKEASESMARLLSTADYRGHYSHGLNRLGMYISDIKTHVCDPSAVPVTLKQSPATAWVDGNNSLGASVGTYCMKLAIKKAKEVGVGWVSCKGSNHYGIAAYYSMMASSEGLVGMTFTNTSPLVAPTRGKDPLLGTNPLSLAAPGNDGDSFVLDMATSAVALGKIEVQRRKEEAIPKGWAMDQNGVNTMDPNVATTGALYPLGGEEGSSGYKGFGLGMLVEVFCGVLGGSHWGPNIRRWMNTKEPADLGQCFFAVNPDCFAPGFSDRMQDLLDTTREQVPVNPEKPVLVAGDPERIHMKKVDMTGGIPYHESLIKACHMLANELEVMPMNEYIK